MASIEQALRDKFYQSASARTCWQDGNYAACLYMNFKNGQAHYQFMLGYPVETKQGIDPIRRHYEYTYFNPQSRKNHTILVVIDRNGTGETHDKFCLFMLDMYLSILKMDKRRLYPIYFSQAHD